MEESNQDEIIGEIENPPDTSSTAGEIDAVYDGTPSAVVHAPPRRIELLDCNSFNALIFHYYSQGEYVECKSLIGEIMSKYDGHNEFALHLRGCIARIEGQLDEALDWFTKAFETSGKNNKYYYDIGRVNFLLGRNAIAAEQLEKAALADPNNPKVIYWLARTVYHLPSKKVKGKMLNPVETARDLILSSPHVATDTQLLRFLGKLLEELDDVQGAIAAYRKALDLQPDNTDVMIRLGLLYMRVSDLDAAFHNLGQCLAYDPTNTDAILAVGAIMQYYSDHDVALNKYRIAAEICDYNGCLWNNIGVGLMARDKLAAAHSAFKKAAFINPMNYKINFNLGVLHESMSLNCSALHYLKLASELTTPNAKIIGAMAVVLSHMKDFSNARKAYKKSIEMQLLPSVLLNYAIFEYHQGNMDEAWNAIGEFRKYQQSAPKCSKEHLSTADLLESVLATSTGKDPNEFKNRAITQSDVIA
ncbi:unnamed protein product [Caenorhabditis bovis]|uniref:Uncharacterized protein n=1 Tax=Caenorhabditis bovis TaxID=2654633 RepID=A0A8S1ENK8_9PELO|nr:unnamed protein product [Caenorhabditis bovis]